MTEPQNSPAPAPAPPVTPPAPLRPVGGPALAAAIAIGVSVAASIAALAVTWYAIGLVDDVLAGDSSISLDDVLAADHLVRAIYWAGVAVLVGAGVVYTVWLWRARRNSEDLSYAPHKWRRSWLITGWFPIVSFWVPRQILDQVYRASRPDNHPDLYDLRSVRGTRLMSLWWGLFVSGSLADTLANRMWATADTVDGLHGSAVVQTISVVLTAGAVVPLFVIMRQISLWQQVPRPR